MKKRILSICGVALVGITLASCGKGGITYSEIKVNTPSEKGNAVESVEAKTTGAYGREITYSLNNKMTPEEVIDALSGSFNAYLPMKESAYNYSSKQISNYTAENDYGVDSNYGYYLKGKETVNTEMYSSKEYYIKSDSFNDQKIYKADANYVKTNNTQDDKTVNSIIKSDAKKVNVFTSNTSNDVTERTMKFASSTETETVINSKAARVSANGSQNSKESYYISASEKSTDDTYGYKYVGYDLKNEETVSYQILSNYGFESNMLSSDYFGTQSYRVSNFYNDEISNLYTFSYELTDKYIILKSDFNFTDEVYNAAFTKSLTGSNLATELKTLMETDYKGSKSSYEIWLAYTKNSIGYAYYKADTLTNYNISKVYEKSDFLEFEFEENNYTDLIGKTYNKKGKVSETTIVSTLTDGYENKINDLFSYCEKNNDYKDIKFKAKKFTLI